MAGLLRQRHVGWSTEMHMWPMGKTMSVAFLGNMMREVAEHPEWGLWVQLRLLTLRDSVLLLIHWFIMIMGTKEQHTWGGGGETEVQTVVNLQINTVVKAVTSFLIWNISFKSNETVQKTLLVLFSFRVLAFFVIYFGFSVIYLFRDKVSSS